MKGRKTFMGKIDVATKQYMSHENVIAEIGEMNTEIKNAIIAADDKTQYDIYAKRLLAQKSILANILVKTVAEFSFYGACPQVMRVLKVAGILGLMHQYESKEEAIYSREV